MTPIDPSTAQRITDLVYAFCNVNSAVGLKALRKQERPYTTKELNLFTGLLHNLIDKSAEPIWFDLDDHDLELARQYPDYLLQLDTFQTFTEHGFTFVLPHRGLPENGICAHRAARELITSGSQIDPLSAWRLIGGEPYSPLPMLNTSARGGPLDDWEFDIKVDRPGLLWLALVDGRVGIGPFSYLLFDSYDSDQATWQRTDEGLEFSDFSIGAEIPDWAKANDWPDRTWSRASFNLCDIMEAADHRCTFVVRFDQTISLLP